MIRRNKNINISAAGRRLFSTSSLDQKKIAMSPIETSVGDLAEKWIKENRIVIFSKTTCPYCVKVKELFHNLNLTPVIVQLDNIGRLYIRSWFLDNLNDSFFFLLDEGAEIQNYLFGKTGQKTVPNVFVNGNHVGGYDDTSKSQSEGRLATLLGGF